MTSYIPLSLRKGLQVSLALTAATLLGVTGSNAFAKSSNCSSKQIEETISFALTATADAPADATGQAKLESKETSTTTKAELELDIRGLEVGTYSVDATLSDSTTVHLADLTVQQGRCQKRSSSRTTRTSRTAKRGYYHHEDDNDDDDDDGDDEDRDHGGDHHDCDENDDNGGSTDISTDTKSKIEIAIPSTVDVSAITTITVSSATTDNTTVPPTTTSTVLLTGEPTSETSSVRFVANVRVTAPPASPLTTTSDASDDASTDDNGKGHGHGKGKGHSKGKHKNKHGRGHDEDEDSSGSQTQSVQGRALAMVCVSGGVEKKNVFQFIATGAPADTELNIVVDGQTVDTVTSSKHGCVKFCGLPDTVDLRTIDLLTITDANGVVLMQADF